MSAALTRPADLPIGATAILYDLGVCEVSAHDGGVVCFRILEGEHAGRFVAFAHDDLEPFALRQLN